MDLDEGQIFRGWGSSLAWEANVLYGNALGPSRVPNPKAQAKFLDMLYGDPQKQLSLGLNIARYNIGGGENPDPGHIKGHKRIHMPTHVEMEGFLDGPGQNYHWE